MAPKETEIFAEFVGKGHYTQWSPEDKMSFVQCVVEFLSFDYRNTKVKLSQTWQDYHMQIIKKLILAEGRVAADVKGATFFIGDIHGKFAEMFTELCTVLYVRSDTHGDYIRRDSNVVFLGDYVDRGTESIRCLNLLFGLKYLFPDRITLLRGNHEEKDTNSMYTFKKECIDSYPERGALFFEEWNSIFERLPVMARVNKKIFCMHGGITEELLKSKYTFDKLSNMTFPVSAKVAAMLENVRWGDPYKPSEQNKELVGLFMFNSYREGGETFSDVAIEKFLKKFEGELMVRGHQKVTNGVEFYKGGKCITLFSAINYLESHNTAAVLRVKPNGHIEIIEFEPPQDPKTAEEDDFAIDDITIRPKKRLGNCGKVVVASCAAVTALFAGGYFVKGSTSAVTTARATIQDLFAERAVMFSRVFNGVALSELLTRGPFSEENLLNELFPLGPEFKVTALRNTSFSNLPQEFESIRNEIGSECTGDVGCGAYKAMMKHMKNVESMDQDSVKLQKSITDAKAMNGTHDVDLMVGNVTTALQTDFATTLDTRIDKLIKLTPTGDKAAVKFVNALTAVMDDLKLLPGHLDDLKSLESASQMLKPPIDILSLISKHISIQTFKEELIKVEAKFKKLRDKANSALAKNVKAKLSILTSMESSAGVEKNVTAGFPKGFEDLNQVLDDVKSAWFNEFFHLAVELKALTARLKPLKKLIEEVGPLHSSWKQVDFESAQQSLNAMKSYVGNFGIFTKFSDLISDSLGCMTGVDVQNKFSADVDSFVGSLNGTVAYFEDVINSINEFTPMLPQLAELQKTVALNEKNMDALPKVIREATIIKDVQKQLKTLIAKIQSKKLDEVEISFDTLKTLDTKVVTPFEAWSGKVDFSELATCIRQLKTQETADQMNLLADELALLKPGNPQVATFNTLVTSLNKVATEVKKVKVSFYGNTRQHHSSGKVRLERPLTDPKILGEISSAVQKLVDVKKHEDDLRNVISGKKTIFDAIEKIQDADEKKRMKGLFNDNTVESLENVLMVASMLDEQIRKQGKLKVVTDFQDAFNKAAKVRESKVNIGKLVKGLEGKIQDKKMAGSLKSLKSLDLKFVKYDTRKIKETLGYVEAFFDALLGINRDVEPTTASPALGTTGIVLIALGCVGGLVVIGGGVFFYRRRNKKEKDDGTKVSPSTSHESRATPSASASSAASASASASATPSASASSVASASASTLATASASNSNAGPSSQSQNKSYKSQRKIPANVTVTPVGKGYEVVESEGFLQLVHGSGRNGWREGQGPVRNQKVVVRLPENYKGAMTQKKLNEAARKLEAENFNTENIIRGKRDPTRKLVEIRPWTRDVLSTQPPEEHRNVREEVWNLENWQENISVIRYETGEGRDIVVNVHRPASSSAEVDATQASEHSDKALRSSGSTSTVRKSASVTRTAEEELKTAASRDEAAV